MEKFDGTEDGIKDPKDRGKEYCGAERLFLVGHLPHGSWAFGLVADLDKLLRTS